MTVEQLVRHYPRLFHMANAGTWESLRDRGLLSTTALLDLFEINGKERHRVESCHRPRSVEIRHSAHGSVVIRDQAPMRESQLMSCLEDIDLSKWYELLNRRVFFWATEHRLRTLLEAKLYRGLEHTVLTVDTASLVRAHGERITLSPINSGNTLYNPPKRGRETFRSIEEYPFEERKRLRGVSNAIAEVAVDYAVPDLRDHLIRVERRRGGEHLATLYERPKGQ